MNVKVWRHQCWTGKKLVRRDWNCKTRMVEKSSTETGEIETSWIWGDLSQFVLFVTYTPRPNVRALFGHSPRSCRFFLEFCNRFKKFGKPRNLVRSAVLVVAFGKRIFYFRRNNGWSTLLHHKNRQYGKISNKDRSDWQSRINWEAGRCTHITLSLHKTVRQCMC